MLLCCLYCLVNCVMTYKSNLTEAYWTEMSAGNAQDLGWEAGGLQSNTLGPGEKRYQGSNSVLKSALQKNVRLCRPEQAVRYARSSLVVCKGHPEAVAYSCSCARGFCNWEAVVAATLQSQKPCKPRISNICKIGWTSPSWPVSLFTFLALGRANLSFAATNVTCKYNLV